MNGRNNYLIVGIFVTLGIVLLIALSLMFAGNRSNASLKRYTLLFERDISGLSLGAPVRYLGVEVGQVIDMQLITAGHTRVRVDLEILESTPITRNSYASLSFQGVTGVAFISLAADSADGSPADGSPTGGESVDAVSGQDNAPPQTNALPQSDVLQQVAGFEYPVIPTRDVGLSALLSTGSDIGNKLTLLLERANILLDDNNLAALSRTLANIEKLSDSLPAQLQATLSQVEQTLKQLETTLVLTEPDILATLQSLKKSSARLDQFMDASLAQTPDLIAETRETLRELEKLLSELRDDPSQVIHRPQSDPVVVQP